MKPRFTHPPDQPLTEKEQDEVDLGPERMAELSMY